MTVTGPETRTRRWVLPADPASAAMARVVIRQALQTWVLDEIAGDVELFASELVANAAAYGRGPITVVLRLVPGARGGVEVSCEVTDTGPGLPRPRRPGLLYESGRGLAIVAAMAAAAGAQRTGTGKTAWFRMRVPGVTSP